jgi:pyridinium-3,5-biscarboxylic acid mononucleotide sulfurtransferase
MGSRAAELRAVVDGMGEVAVAVSGGVDSMTLAVVTHRRLGQAATMVHAVSPAVPPEASARVRAHAKREGWRLEVIDAGEFRDERYLANPANRCFFCKTNLYGTVASRTRGTILSGTNLDDLGDWRPGLRAASDHGVRHPYVEAGLDKAAVRALARSLGLDDVAELPAAPCLSSRLETGIGVTAERLRLVHAVERLIGRKLAPKTVRCRILHDGIAIQLDPDSLARVSGSQGDELRKTVRRVLAGHGRAESVRFEPYRMGSAFHRPAAHGG